MSHTDEELRSADASLRASAKLGRRPARPVTRPTRASPRLAGAAVWAIILLASGCTPTCEQSCHKLLGCELADSPRTAQRECVDACTAEESLYSSWKDDDPDQKLDRLKAQRRCIGSSTCDEIDAGVCYDETLESF